MNKDKLAESDSKFTYRPPEFSSVDLAIITLGGTAGDFDTKTNTAGSSDLSLESAGSGSLEEYDDDPLGDPWSRGDG